MEDVDSNQISSMLQHALNQLVSIQTVAQFNNVWVQIRVQINLENRFNA